MNIPKALKAVIEYYGETVAGHITDDKLKAGKLLHEDIGTGDAKENKADLAIQVFADIINYVGEDTPSGHRVYDEILALKAALSLYDITATGNKADDRYTLYKALLSDGVALLPQENLTSNLVVRDGALVD